MEPIVQKKGKVELSERLSLQNIFINLTVSFKKETVTNQGKESETVIGTEYPSEQAQVQFDASNLDEIDTVKVRELLDQAIQQFTTKI